MKRLLSSAALLASLSIAMLPAADAATIAIDTTIELLPFTLHSVPGISNGVDWPFYKLPEPVYIAVGDTVDMTVRFAPGSSITMASNGGVQVFGGALFMDVSREPENTSSYTVSDASLTFFDASGQAVLSLFTQSHSNGVTQIGPYFSNSYLPQGSSITFASYRSTFTVAALQDGGKWYAGPSLYVGTRDDGLVQINTSPVPEPAIHALMLAGLALGLYVARRGALKSRPPRGRAA